MNRREEVDVQREALLSQMRLIRSVRRGTLSIRPEKVYRKGRKEPVLLGPYPLFVRREGKRVVGVRLRSLEEVAQVREDIAAYERFMALCREFAEVTEQLGELERAEAVRTQGPNKGRRLRSSRTRKLRD